MLQGFFTIAYLLTVAFSQVIDLRTSKKVENTWLEVGSTTLSTYEWVTIQTQNKNFSQPVLFLSTPLSLDGQTFPYPLQIRGADLETNSLGLAFKLKLLTINSSYCSKQWWIPANYPSTLKVSWFITEKGGYSVNGSKIVIGTNEISVNQVKIDWEFKFGTTCHYPSQEGDDDIAPAGLFTLQTMRNTDAYLSARTTWWWYKGEISKCSYSWQSGRLFLEPHEGYPSEERSKLLSETVGYLLYESTPHVITCLAGNSFEFVLVQGLTDQPKMITLRNPVDSSTHFVGIYGSVNGYQGGDSFGIRSFYETTETFSPKIYLQEDQCSDSEVVHLPESAAIVIVTPSATSCSQDPFLTEYTDSPTMAPSTSPTTSLSSNEGQAPKKNSDLLLAIVLPIVILAAIAIVGLIARAYFATGKGDMIPLSEDSGDNLVFDT